MPPDEALSMLMKNAQVRRTMSNRLLASVREELGASWKPNGASTNTFGMLVNLVDHEAKDVALTSRVPETGLADVVMKRCLKTGNYEVLSRLNVNLTSLSTLGLAWNLGFCETFENMSLVLSSMMATGKTPPGRLTGSPSEMEWFAENWPASDTGRFY